MTTNRWSHYLTLTVSVFTLALVGCSRASREAGHLRKANRYFEAKQFDKAEIEYLNVARSNPTNILVITRLGAIYQAKGDIPRAFSAWSMAAKLEPGNLEVRTHMASVYMLARQFPKAREAAVAILSASPTNHSALLILAEASQTAEEIEDAKKRLDALPKETQNTAAFHLALGRLWSRQGNSSAAEAAFKQAHALDPRSTGAALGLASIYWRRGDTNQAEKEFKAASDGAAVASPERLAWAEFKRRTGGTAEAKKILQDAAGQAPKFLPAWMALADMAYEERRFEDARASLDKVLAVNAKHFDAQFFTALVKIAQEDLKGGLAELERLSGEYPRVPKLEYERARALLRNNDPGRAYTAVELALAADPDHAEAILLRATLDARSGNFTAAVSALQQLVKNRPNLEAARFLLASVYAARGTPEDALQVYRVLEKISPKNAQVPYSMGVTYRQARKVMEARQAFERALALAPDSPTPVGQLMELDVEEKNFSAALQRAEALVQKNPKSPEPLFAVARIHLVQSNLPLAEAALRKVLDVSPEFRPAHLELARLDVRSHRYDAARDKLQALVRKNPKDTRALMELGTLYESNREYQRAAQTYEDLIKEQTNAVPALNNLAYLYAEHLGTPEKAQELAQKARSLAPQDPYTADTLGWVLYKRGEFERALPLIQEAADRLPSNSEVVFHRGATFYMLGREPAARADLEKSLSAEGDLTWKKEAQRQLVVLQSDPAKLDSAAADVLKKSLAEHPGDPTILARLGAFYERSGSSRQAIESYEQALQRNSKLAAPLLRLARLYGTQGNDKKASEYAKLARAAAPGDPQVAALLGILAYDRKEYAGALTFLREAEQAGPAPSETLYYLAQTYFHLGQVKESEDAIERALRLKDEFDLAPARSLREMIALYNAPDKLAVNEPRILTALKADPQSLPALMLRAMSREQRSQIKEAKEQYEEIVRKYPAFVPARKRLALVYSDKLEDDKSAYEVAIKARESLPEDLDLARVLGKALLARRDYSGAVNYLKQCVRGGKVDAEIFYQLGKAHYGLKEMQPSREALEKAILLNPSASFVKEAKDLLAQLAPKP